MKIEYFETTIQKVLDYFINGLANAVYKCEPFVDSRTGKIILKLYLIEEGDANEEGRNKSS